MRRFAPMFASIFVVVSGCSDMQPETRSFEVIERLEAPAAAPENEFGFWEAQEQGIDLFGQNEPSARSVAASTYTTGRATGDDAQASAAATAPGQQIAYSYAYGFRIDGSEIAALQDAHIALCEQMGDACRVIRTSQASSDNWDAYGELRMQIAADQTSNLSEDLVAPAEELGGALVSSVRDGEDLTEKIIDTEARLQSRLVLRDKLTDILRRNRGSVDELVKAERAVADVNEQIDSTRSRLQRYRNRVRYSDVRIEYEPNFGQNQIGFVQPVATAFRSIGSNLGMTVGALIYLVTALIPIIAVLLLIRWLLHRFGLRIRFWRKAETVE